MPLYTDFGLRARNAMLIKGIKSIVVAEKAGISPSYLSDIFRGARVGKKYKPIIAKMLEISEQEKGMITNKVESLTRNYAKITHGVGAA